MTPADPGPDEVAPALEPLLTEETARSEASDADLLQGLSDLAELFSNASQTLNQCLLTLEQKLSSMVIAQAEWVPIQTARSAVELVPCSDEPVDARQQSQERMFGGVPVTIIKMSAPGNERPSAGRFEWQYELGYSVIGEQWALVIRTATFDPSKQSEGGFNYSGAMPLCDAPLEIRLKAIREIPVLIRLLEEGGARSNEPAGPDTVVAVETAIETTAELAPDWVPVEAGPEAEAQLSLFGL